MRSSISEISFKTMLHLETLVRLLDSFPSKPNLQTHKSHLNFNPVTTNPSNHYKFHRDNRIWIKALFNSPLYSHSLNLLQLLFNLWDRSHMQFRPSNNNNSPKYKHNLNSKCLIHRSSKPSPKKLRLTSQI